MWFIDTSKEINKDEFYLKLSFFEICFVLMNKHNETLCEIIT